MSKYIRVAKDIAITAIIVIALWASFLGRWDIAAFYMAFVCYLILVRREDDV
jgi:Ca2+/Na+ antiporter